MRCLLTSALLLLLAAGAWATTMVVDGVGASPEHFATIREALMALGGPLGTDGASDEIAIVIDQLTEPVGFVVNGGFASAGDYGPLRDDLTILGDADDNGQRCVVDISADNGVFNVRERLTFHLADGQDLTLRDLILIPTYVGTDVVTNFVVVDEADHETPLLNASLTLDNVFITASLPGNVPKDPDDTSSGGTAISDMLQEKEVLAVQYNPPGSSVTYTVTDCVFAHQRAPVLSFRLDSGTVDISNTRLVRNGYYHPASGGIRIGGGIWLWSESDVTLNLSHMTCELAVGSGLAYSTPTDQELLIAA